MIYIFYFGLLIFCFYKVKYCKGKNNFWDGYLSKENTLMLKGFFSIFVVLGHGITYYELEDSFSNAFQRIGPAGIAVMFFFFISGYGVMSNWMNNDKYDKGFLLKRFKAIIPIYFVAIFIYWLANAYVGVYYSFKEIVYLFITGYPIALHSWQIIVTLVFYLLFFLQMKIFNHNYLYILIFSFLLSFVWIIVCPLIGYDDWWSISVLSIPIGQTWALYKDKIDQFIQKRYISCLVVVFLLYFLSFIYFNYEGILFRIINATMDYRRCIFTTVLLMILLMKLKLGNIIFEFLGEISFETYLFHGLFINYFINSDWFDGNISLCLFIVLLSSLLFAILIHYLFKYINRKCRTRF